MNFAKHITLPTDRSNYFQYVAGYFFKQLLYIDITLIDLIGSFHVAVRHFNV